MRSWGVHVLRNIDYYTCVCLEGAMTTETNCMTAQATGRYIRTLDDDHTFGARNVLSTRLEQHR